MDRSLLIYVIIFISIFSLFCSLPLKGEYIYMVNDVIIQIIGVFQRLDLKVLTCFECNAHGSAHCCVLCSVLLRFVANYCDLSRIIALCYELYYGNVGFCSLICAFFCVFASEMCFLCVILAICFSVFILALHFVECFVLCGTVVCLLFMACNVVVCCVFC